MICIACFGWSCMTVVQGFAEKIWLLFVCRFMLGFFQAACNPPAYGIISDYFPPNWRTRANSIYSLGIYVGGGLSSLSILIITAVGWRWMFRIIGIVGLGSAVLTILFVREPKRGRYDPPKTENV